MIEMAETSMGNPVSSAPSSAARRAPRRSLLLREPAQNPAGDRAAGAARRAGPSCHPQPREALPAGSLPASEPFRRASCAWPTVADGSASSGRRCAYVYYTRSELDRALPSSAVAAPAVLDRGLHSRVTFALRSDLLSRSLAAAMLQRLGALSCVLLARPRRTVGRRISRMRISAGMSSS